MRYDPPPPAFPDTGKIDIAKIISCENAIQQEHEELAENKGLDCRSHFRFFRNLCTRKNYKDKIHFGIEKRDCTDPWCGRAGKFLLAFPNVKIRGILSPEGSLGDIQESGGEQDRHVGCSGDKKVCAAKSD